MFGPITKYGINTILSRNFSCATKYSCFFLIKLPKAKWFNQ